MVSPLLQYLSSLFCFGFWLLLKDRNLVLYTTESFLVPYINTAVVNIFSLVLPLILLSYQKIWLLPNYNFLVSVVPFDSYQGVKKKLKSVFYTTNEVGSSMSLWHMH